MFISVTVEELVDGIEVFCLGFKSLPVDNERELFVGLRLGLFCFGFDHIAMIGPNLGN